MGRVAFGLLLLLSVQRPTFEPARLESGPVEAIPYRTAAAGIVLAEVALNERGGVTAVQILKAVDPFTEVIQQSVQRWRFAPARDKGRMVETHVLVAGLFRPAMLLFPEPKIDVEVNPSSKVPLPTGVAVPPYPPNAVGSRYVLIEVKLSEDGMHEDARVVSPKTGFDDSALDAARGWSFRPAMRENKPVPAYAYLIFLFRQPN